MTVGVRGCGSTTWSPVGPLTFGADASQVGDLHQHLGEHVRFVGSPPPHVDLQGLEQRLLQDIHLVRLLQVLAVYRRKNHNV